MRNFTRLGRVALAWSFAMSWAFAPAAAGPVYPATRTVPVSNTYFGTTVPDPYRWLEDATAPDVRRWAAVQTARALKRLRASPHYAAYKARVARLVGSSVQRFGLTIRGGHFVYLRETPPDPQPQLVARDGVAGSERVLFDPKALAVRGAQPSIEFYALSPDGKRVAVSTQYGGSEEQTIRVIDTASGTMLPDVLPHAGGGTSPVAIAWDGDGNGFSHTLWPKRPDGTYATSGILIDHHVLGSAPASDTYVFGIGQSPKVEFALRTSLDGSMTSVSAADGDGVHASLYLRRGNGPFSLVASPAAGIGDSESAGGDFVGDAFYAVAHPAGPAHSRGEIVALAPGGTFETARVVVPPSTVAVEDLIPVADGFATIDDDGGDETARVFGTDGTVRRNLPVPPVSSVSEIAGDPNGGPIVFAYQNDTTPSRWLALDPQSGSVSPTGVAETSPGDFSNVTVDRVFAPSSDGSANVPLEIVRAKNVRLDGTAPTIMYAYGAYGITIHPDFEADALAWLERGGIMALARVRGGGDYGEDWHLAARHATKTRSSDDLASCARWLFRHHYTTSRHLGIRGGSAGGFLMGLALTRDPALYRAVDSEVGIYDLLRFQLTPNGAYNTPELGTVKDPAQFAFMLRQSPYHRVRKGVAYPAVLLTTGENDPRVDPYNSRKMAAVLQADTASANPIFLVQRSGTGHGIGDSIAQRVEGTADYLSFFDEELR